MNISRNFINPRQRLLHFKIPSSELYELYILSTYAFEGIIENAVTLSKYLICAFRYIKIFRNVWFI